MLKSTEATNSFRHVPAVRHVRFTYVFVALLVTAAAALVSPSRSEAYLYFPVSESEPFSTESGYIGRANLNGTTLNREQVSTEIEPVMATAAGEYLYWFNKGSRNLSRAKTDGSGVELNYIENLLTEKEMKQEGLYRISGLVVASGHVYWSVEGFAMEDAIRRASLSGSEINRSFIAEIEGGVQGLAAEGSYVYWDSNKNQAEPKFEDPGFGAVIGRATLSGTGVERNFITGLNECTEACGTKYAQYEGLRVHGLAANESYLYLRWEKGNGASGGIARVARSGGKPEIEFVSGFPSEKYTNADGPPTIVATNEYVYWIEEWTQAITRVNADGTNPYQDVVCELPYPNEEGVPWVHDGTAWLAADSGSTSSSEPLSGECALEAFVPELRLDSQEPYQPLSVESIIYNQGEEEGNIYTNALHYDGGTREVTSSESVHPYEGPREGYGGKIWGLYPEFLATVYPDGIVASKEDAIDERNGHYVEDSQSFDSYWQPPVIYGDVQTGSDGRRWLQYWIFYYYDESEFFFSGVGSHEGDWEMIEIAINDQNEPEQIAFAQHESGAECEWNEIETDHFDHPIVYVAVGTHASYPIAGPWNTPAELTEDQANGEGAAFQPQLKKLQYERNWPYWPGRWGGTTAGEVPGEANSPTGPAEHSQWAEPAQWAEGLASCYDRYEGEAPRAAERAAALPRTSVEAGGKADDARGAEPSLEAARYAKGHVWLKYSATKVSRDDRLYLSIVPNGEPPESWTVEHVKPQEWVKAPFNFSHLPDGVALASIFSPGAGRSEMSRLAIGE